MLISAIIVLEMGCVPNEECQSIIDRISRPQKRTYTRISECHMFESAVLQ